MKFHVKQAESVDRFFDELDARVEEKREQGIVNGLAAALKAEREAEEEGADE